MLVTAHESLRYLNIMDSSPLRVGRRSHCFILTRAWHSSQILVYLSPVLPDHFVSALLWFFNKHTVDGRNPVKPYK